MPVRFAPDATFPRQLVVEADVKSNRLVDPAGTLATQLTSLLQADALKGKRIAVGSGSRGIDRIPEIVRAVVAVLKAKGAEPFIVPVMGNHGGSTAEGQGASSRAWASPRPRSARQSDRAWTPAWSATRRPARRSTSPRKPWLPTA